MAGAVVGRVAGDRAAAVRVVVLIFCLVVPTALFGVIKSMAVSDGTLTLAGSGRWEASGIVVTGVVGRGRGLHVGDRVMAIDDRPVSSSIAPWGGHLKAGDQVTYTVQRTEPGDRTVDLLVDIHLTKYDLAGAVLKNWPFVPLVASLDLVAALVFLRRPHEPAAWTILVLAVLVPFTAFEWPAGPQVVDLLGGQGIWGFEIGDAAGALTFVSLLLFALVFPRPRKMIQHHPGAVIAAVATGGIVPYLAALPAISSRSDPVARLAGQVYVSAWYARTYPVLIVVVFVVAYRRAGGADERRGLRWVLGGFGAALIIYLLLFQIPLTLLGRPLIRPAFEALLFAPIPLSVGAGILRYRLIDVGPVIKRSLVYTGATAASLAVFVVSLWALGQVVHTQLILFTLGGLVALAVFWARSRVQPVIVRRYFGDRDDPYRIVSRIVEVDTGASAHDALAEAARTIQDALRLSYVSVDVTTIDGDFEPVVEIGDRTRPPVHVELRHGTDVVGRIGLDAGTDREGFGNTDERLLRDLSVHVGAVVHAVRLNLDLQRSRETLVVAREEERRRIRRDLHDGLGPTLAATAMQMEAAQFLLRIDPAEAGRLLDQMRAAVQDAIADIRRLVDDLRPPALDQLGLLAAIEERVVTFNQSARDGHGPFRVQIEGRGALHDLPAAIEVAAYRITVEAVTNAARHARATTCQVRLRRVGPRLEIEVGDNGTGIDGAATPHVGLHSMRERAEEIGGTCQILQADAGGTVVHVSLPALTPALTTALTTDREVDHG